MCVCVCSSGNPWKAGLVSNTDRGLSDAQHRAGKEEVLNNIGWSEVKFIF